ncbi:MAG: HAD family hydrolase [Myxococcota bacterium]
MALGAVFFDFGGTLFSYSRVQGRAFYPILIDALERLGLDLEPRAAGRAYRKASADAFEAYAPRPYYLHRDLFHETLRSWVRSLGGDEARADAVFLDWFHERQRCLVRDGFELRSGCLEVLRALRAWGLHTAIVSNIDDDYLEPMVERAGLRAELDAWTSSEEARSCKPDPQIFRHALRKAGVRAREVLFVGDSPQHDIAGARSLGMATVLIREPGVASPGGSGLPAVAPDFTIEQLGELLPIVRDLRERAPRAGVGASDAE